MKKITKNQVISFIKCAIKKGRISVYTGSGAYPRERRYIAISLALEALDLGYNQYQSEGGFSDFYPSRTFSAKVLKAWHKKKFIGVSRILNKANKYLSPNQYLSPNNWYYHE